MTHAQTIPSVTVIPRGEIDLAARVEAARRAKGGSPFVGIATPHGTLMLRRDVLKKSLQGLRVIEAELVTDTEGMITGAYRNWEQSGGTSEWNSSKMCYERKDVVFSLGAPVKYRAKLAIRVYAVGDRVKATRLYTHQPWKIGSGMLHPLLESWQRANMRKWGVCDCHDFYRRKTCKHIETATRPKLNKYEKAIAKLKKEIPRDWRPENPAVSNQIASDSLRRQWREWYLQKDARRKVMALAIRTGYKHPHRTQVKADLSSTKLYVEVAKLTAPQIVTINQQDIMDALNSGKPTAEWPRERYAVEVQPVTITKWGELTAYARERKGLGDLFDYLKRLWEFCGLAEKPYRDHDAPTWGAEHYKGWLHDLHTRKQLVEQIAAIRAEAEGKL